MFYSQSKKEDVIYLKNGSIIRGTILDTLKNETLRISIYGNSIFAFKFDEIEKVTQEDILEVSPKDIHKQKGFYNITYYGIMTEGGSNLTTINGYKFKSKYFVGIGCGPEFKFNSLFNFFIDFRYDILKTQKTPFAYINAGYSVPTKQSLNAIGYYDSKPKVYGGYLSDLGLGFKAHLKNKTAFLFSLGFSYRNYMYSYIPYKLVDRTYVNETYARYNAKIGFNFN